jgi:hypothetical protein
MIRWYWACLRRPLRLVQIPIEAKRFCLVVTWPERLRFLSTQLIGGTRSEVAGSLKGSALHGSSALSADDSLSDVTSPGGVGLESGIDKMQATAPRHVSVRKTSDLSLEDTRVLRRRKGLEATSVATVQNDL